MPEVQEVFRMATQKVRPDPGALERQHRGQRRRTVRRKAAVFGLVAAIVLVAVIVALSTIPGDGTEPAETPTPTPVAGATGVGVYAVDPIDGETTKLFDANGAWMNPERSPDGGQVVYQSRVSGRSQIFVLETDGTQRQLTRTPKGATDPTWSPDGTQIAFESQDGRDHDIFVMNADGSELRRLGGTPGVDVGPDWSPDGSRIVFYSEGDDIDGTEIWAVSFPDGILTHLTRNGVYDAGPAWSPDGRWVAFSRADGPNEGISFLGNPGTDIWLMRPDGTEQHLLLDDAVDDDHPTWSPDGLSIAYLNSILNVVDVETGEVRAVSHWAPGPSWGPDGLILVSLN